jgi:hypothetical protein
VFLTTASQTDLTRLIQWIVDFKSKKKPGAADPCKQCVSTVSAKAAKEEHKKRKREEKEAQVNHAFLMSMLGPVATLLITSYLECCGIQN